MRVSIAIGVQRAGRVHARTRLAMRACGLQHAARTHKVSRGLPKIDVDARSYMAPEQRYNVGSTGHPTRCADQLRSVGEQLGERGGRQHARGPGIELIEGSYCDALLDLWVHCTTEALPQEA